MSLLVNTVFEVSNEPGCYRVLAVIAPDQLVFFDMTDPKALPGWRSAKLLEELLESGEARIIEDPFAEISNKREEDITEASKKLRDAAWKAIQNLVEISPGVPNYLIFDRKARGQMIRAALERDETAKAEETKNPVITTIFKYLRKWWRGGQILNALLPDYVKSGGKGKPRTFTDKKPGRKNLSEKIRGIGPGIQITDEVAKKLHRAYERHKNSPLSVPKIYNHVLREFFNDGYEHIGNSLVKRPPDPNDSITLNQFRYFWTKSRSGNLTDFIKGRYGNKKYNQRYRPRRGTAPSFAYGPGSRYQIDATLLDCYVVSKLNRRWIIGRPWLYVVMDTFTGLVVGHYLTLENPSWIAAALALDNAFSDKVVYAEEKFGIKVNGFEVPAKGRCQSIIFDRGEGASKKVNVVVSGLGIRVSNLPAYRPDWKSFVEVHFRLLNDEVFNWVPGATHDLSGRSGKRYQYDAALNMDEIDEIIFEALLTYNLIHEIKDYPFDEQIYTEAIVTNPLELWHWGTANRTGILKKYDPATDRISLLPRESGSITADGIIFSSRRYLSPKLDEHQLQVRARYSGVIKTTIAYDSRNPGAIYFREPTTEKFEIATLHPEDASWANYQLSEWQYADAIYALQVQDREPMKRQAVANRDHRVKEIVDNALAEKSREISSGSKAKPADIRKNRAREREYERSENPLINAPDTAKTEPNEAHPETIDDYIPAPNNLDKISQWDEELTDEDRDE